MGDLNPAGIGANERRDEQILKANLDADEIQSNEPDFALEPAEQFIDTLQNYSDIATENPNEAMDMAAALKREIMDAFGIEENNPNYVHIEMQSRIETLADAIRSNEPEEIETAAMGLFDGAIDSPARLNELAGYMLAQNGGHLAGLSVGGKNPWEEAQLRERRENDRAINVATASASAAALAAANAAADLAAAEAIGEFLNRNRDALDRIYAAVDRNAPEATQINALAGNRDMQSLAEQAFDETAQAAYKEAYDAALLANGGDEEAARETALTATLEAASDQAQEGLADDMRSNGGLSATVSDQAAERLIEGISDKRARLEQLLEADGLTSTNFDEARELSATLTNSLNELRMVQSQQGMQMLAGFVTGSIAATGITKDELIEQVRQGVEFNKSSITAAAENAQSIMDFAENLRNEINDDINEFADLQTEIDLREEQIQTALEQAEIEKAEILNQQAEIDTRYKALTGAVSPNGEIRIASELSDLNQEIAQNKEKLEALENKIAQLETEKADYEQQSLDLQERVSIKTDELHEFENTVLNDAEAQMKIANLQLELSNIGAQYIENIIERAPNDLSGVDVDFLKQAMLDAPPELFQISEELNNLTGYEGHNPFDALIEIADQLPPDQKAELLDFAETAKNLREKSLDANAWQEAELQRAENAASYDPDGLGLVQNDPMMMGGVISAMAPMDGSGLGAAMEAQKETLAELAELRAGRELDGVELETAIYQEAVLQKIGGDGEISRSEINEAFTNLGLYGDKLNNAQSDITAFLQEEHGTTVVEDTEAKMDLPEEPAPLSPEELAQRQAFQAEMDVWTTIKDEGLSSISKEDLMNRLEDAGISGEQLTISTEQLIADFQNEEGVDFVTGLEYPEPLQVADLEGHAAQPDTGTEPSNNEPATQPRYNTLDPQVTTYAPGS